MCQKYPTVLAPCGFFRAQWCNTNVISLFLESSVITLSSLNPLFLLLASLFRLFLFSPTQSDSGWMLLPYLHKSPFFPFHLSSFGCTLTLCAVGAALVLCQPQRAASGLCLVLKRVTWLQNGGGYRRISWASL